MPAAHLLVDTGPLVALFDRRDRHHARVVAAWKGLRGPVDTIWPVVTEAVHLLAFSAPAYNAVFDLLTTGAMRLLALDGADLPRVRELMEKYADLPLDFADACLVRVAERERLRRVFTLDRAFRVVRPRHVRRLAITPTGDA